jgi:hypothetical protein
MTRPQHRPVPAWLPTGSQLELLELQQMEERLRRWGGSSRRPAFPIAPAGEPWRV